MRVRCVPLFGLWLGVAILAIGGGCGDSKPNSLILGDFAYPLQVGQTWLYSGSYQTFNFQPESLAYSHSESRTFQSTVQIVQKFNLLDSLEVYGFKETIIESGKDPTYSWHYMNNSSEGLYRYAYTLGDVRVTPRKPAVQDRSYRFHGKTYASIEELLRSSDTRHEGEALDGDSIKYDVPPFRSLKYPLTTGSEWPVRVPPGSMMLNKKVIDEVKIQVPAGVFNCARIQWLYGTGTDGQVDSDMQVFDYVARIGLVKRTQVFHNVTVTDYEHPLGAGTCDISEIWMLRQTPSLTPQ
jgi:hypothetical protein